jgi:ATP-dependent RNA helicase RhlB
VRFAELDVPPEVQEGIRAAGFTIATPIQEAALPVALRGKDVAGQAQTGTGKTAAFLVSTFTRLLRHAPASHREASPRALIIAPTRELVVQIDSDARQLGQFTGLRTALVFGGVDYIKQRESLQGPLDLLIGTPGRLIDYLKQHAWSPSRVEVLVLDEADRMFDMGFIADIRWILRRLPPPEARQSFLFSATLSFRVLELTYEFMNNPAQITVSPEQVTVERVEQVLYHAGRHEKFGLLLGLLAAEEGGRILIFTNTRDEVHRVVERLERNGYMARALSGDVDQRKRLKTLEAFKDGSVPILVATDVASRGLHIPDVTHVYNWDLPQDPEDYVHRIGRTARAGATGKAISLVDEASAFSLEGVERFIGQRIRVEWAEDAMFLPEVKPTAEERRRSAEAREARRAGHGGRGPRPGGPVRRPLGGRPARPAEIPRRPRAERSTGRARRGTASPARRGGGDGQAPPGPGRRAARRLSPPLELHFDQRVDHVPAEVPVAGRVEAVSVAPDHGHARSDRDGHVSPDAAQVLPREAVSLYVVHARHVEADPKLDVS